MGWFRDRVEASRAQRTTRADADAALANAHVLLERSANQRRLRETGIQGTATIVDIRRDVAHEAGISWHEFILDVSLPDRDVYRATRRVAVELSTTPQLRPGAQVPVAVDRDDRTNVVITANL